MLNTELSKIKFRQRWKLIPSDLLEVATIYSSPLIGSTVQDGSANLYTMSVLYYRCCRERKMAYPSDSVSSLFL